MPRRRKTVEVAKAGKGNLEEKMTTANRKPLKDKHKEKDLKTISKDLSHTRQLVNTAKRGQGFFKRLRREEKEKETMQLMEQRKQMEKHKTAWQPPKFSSEEESDEEYRIFKTEPVLSSPLRAVQCHSQKMSSKGKKVATRPYTPLHFSLVSTTFTEKDVGPLHRQLCALNWLLEAMVMEPPNTLNPVSTCWSARDPVRMKSGSKKISKEKSIEIKWEQFISQSKFKKSTIRVMQKTPFRLRRACYSAASSPNVSSSAVTPAFDSASSEVTSSDDVGMGTPRPTLDSVSDSDDDSTISSFCTRTKQDQGEEEPISDYLQKLLDSVHEHIDKELHGEENDSRNNEESSIAVRSNGKVSPQASYNMELQADVNRLKRHKSSPSGQISEISQFSASKSSLSQEMHSKFIEVSDEAALCLHDNLEALEKKRWDTSKLKFRALDSITNFYTYTEDMQRSLQECKENKTEGSEQTWFSSLLSRVPPTVQGNQKISQVLQRLESFEKRQNFRIRPQQFFRVLHGLQNWELCSPDISAAVEFVQVKVIQMPAEDYDSWLWSKLDLPKRIQSAPTIR
ncbi:coiled-coil domain-containing protein 60-like isoform X2 [Narcine bancroftii]|uniref:coiled-coil domain-containing protein 60-like isoform X2 n=1 Tax=Narcine bancroftii TaxID=1343680 RepID=UPI003831870F